LQVALIGSVETLTNFWLSVKSENLSEKEISGACGLWPDLLWSRAGRGDSLDCRARTMSVGCRWRRCPVRRRPHGKKMTVTRWSFKLETLSGCVPVNCEGKGFYPSGRFKELCFSLTDKFDVTSKAHNEQHVFTKPSKP
jgi:hypothetical protein